MAGMEDLMKDLGVSNQEELMKFVAEHPEHKISQEIKEMIYMLDELDGTPSPYNP